MSLRKRLVAALVTMALVPGLSLGMTETAAARGGGFSGGHFGGGVRWGPLWRGFWRRALRGAPFRRGGFQGRALWGGGSVVATLEVVSAAGTSRDPISAVDGGISADSTALPALAPLRQPLASTTHHSFRPLF